MKYFTQLFLVFFLIQVSSITLEAQWNMNSKENTPIFTDSLKSEGQKICSDNLGGAYICFSNYKNDTSFIFLQHINKNGVKSWNKNGIILAKKGGKNFAQLYEPNIISDNLFGVIVVWIEHNEAVLCQRINLNGDILWDSNGIKIYKGKFLPTHPQIVSDGHSGAIICWNDFRNHANDGTFDTFVQKVDSSGKTKWEINGIKVFWGSNQRMVAGSNGSAIISCHTSGEKSNNIPNLRISKLDSSGLFMWQQNGILLSGAIRPSQDEIISDGEGGIIATFFAWPDSFIIKTYENRNLYIQKIDGKGNFPWGLNGLIVKDSVQFYQTNYDENKTILTSDGKKGAIICWNETKSDYNTNIYSQRVDHNGILKWSNPIPICEAEGDQVSITMSNDKYFGAIISWMDQRMGVGSANLDIYAQRIDSSGNIKWKKDGEIICNAKWEQSAPEIISDNKGGGIVIWQDGRLTGGIQLIYAQNICSQGKLGVMPLGKIDSIIGPLNICFGSVNTFKINQVQGSTSYNWVLPDGWVGIPNGKEIVVNASPISGNITMKANNECGDTISASIFVKVNPLPNIKISAVDSLICKGDTITLTASGGKSYIWAQPSGIGNSINISPETNTNYQVIGEDDYGCINSDSLLIKVNQKPIIKITSLNLEICDGDTATLSANGATTYEWGPGKLKGKNISVAPNTTTEYTVIGTDINGCQNNDSTTVLVHEKPIVSAKAINPIICIKIDSDSLIGTPAGGSWSGNGVIDSIFYPAKAGLGLHIVEYSFQDNFGCVGVDTVQITVTNCVATNELKESDRIIIYPNPTKGLLSLFQNSLTGNYNLEVIDQTGRKLISKTGFAENSIQLDLSSLESGMYYLLLKQEELVRVLKIVRK